jgi:seryl-tRNA synthetase
MLENNDRTIESAVEELLKLHIIEAISIVSKSKKNSDAQKIINLFDKTKKFVLASQVYEKELDRKSTTDILRLATINHEHVLIPKTNAIGVVLRHNLRKPPSLKEWISMLKNDTA